MSVGSLIFVIREFVDLIDSKIVLILSKSDKTRYVLLLCPRFDVKSNIHQNTVFSLRISVLEHEGGCHAGCDTLANLENCVDLMLSIVGLRAVNILGIGLLEGLDGFLSHKRIMDSCSFIFFVEGDLEIASTPVFLDHVTL